MPEVPVTQDDLAKSFENFITAGGEPVDSSDGEETRQSDEEPEVKAKPAEDHDNPENDEDDQPALEDKADEGDEDDAEDIPDEDGEAEDDPDDDVLDDGEFEDVTEVALSDESVVDVHGEKIPFSELKNGYLRQSDATVKTMAAAEKEKSNAEAEKQVLATHEQLMQINAVLLGHLNTILPEEPDVTLYRTDPVLYQDQKIQRDTVLQQIQAVQGTLEQSYNQFGEQNKAKTEANMLKEGQSLANARPFLRDPEKRAPYFGNLTSGAQEYYGFPAEEVMGISDHRAFLVLEDAIRYRKLKSGKPAKKRGKGGKTPMRGGARKSGKTNSLAHAEQQVAKAVKSGRIQDASGVLGAILLSEGR